MNKKLLKYIEYVVKDIEPPYFYNMEFQYGINKNKDTILDKIFKQKTNVCGNTVYDTQWNVLYNESNCLDTNKISWDKSYYNERNNRIYYEDSDGFWYRKEFDEDGKEIFFENSGGLRQIGDNIL